MATPFSVSDLYNLYRTYQLGSVAGDESYNPAAHGPWYMSEADFNALSERERMDLAGRYTTGQTNVYQDEGGNLVGYGDPRYMEQGGWFDPLGMTTDENGRFTISRDAVNWDALNDIQNASDRSGFFSGTPLQNIARGAGIVLGVGGLNNFLTSGSMFGGSGVPTGGLLSESVAPQVTETMMGSPFGSGAISVAGALAESAAPQVTEQMAAAPNLGGNSWLSSLGNTIRNNPMSAIRLGMTGAGLIGGAMGNQQPQSSLGGLGGLLGGSLNIKKANWTPNPYSVSQLQQLYGGKF